MAETKEAKVTDLVQDDHNFNKGTAEGQVLMNQSLARFGAGRSILIDKNNRIIAGNKTAETFKELGKSKVRIIESTGDELIAVKRTDIDLDSKEGREMALADNATGMVNLSFDEVELQAAADEYGFDLNDWGIGPFDEDPAAELAKQTKKEERQVKQLKDDFILPPMSVLDTKNGQWQQRRNFWIEKTGIRSEEGRDENLTFALSAQGSGFYILRNEMREKLGYDPSAEEVMAKMKELGLSAFNGTSIFDPVLCELMYRWFNVKGGKILDPFAGGSVRGVMAGQLRMEYHGNDLSEKQVLENRRQSMWAFPEDWTGPLPRWTIGDSTKLDEILKADGFGDEQFDMVFSCPPYADLEVYSNDPHDISNMKYPEFLECYRKIIKKACAKLKDNRFAVFVISEVRGNTGEYYNFVSDTIRAFLDAGLKYYNEIILVNQIGSKSIIARKGMAVGRKVGRHHQNILVFAKGDPLQANRDYEELDVKKALKQFNEFREVSDKHCNVLVFYKGNPQNIRLDFTETTPPDPDWNEMAEFMGTELIEDKDE